LIEERRLKPTLRYEESVSTGFVRGHNCGERGSIEERRLKPTLQRKRQHNWETTKMRDEKTRIANFCAPPEGGVTKKPKLKGRRRKVAATKL